MDVTFYLAATVAIVATVLVVTRANAVHALLYLVVSLLGVALVFFDLDAPFAAALEIIVYAGAIMILFVFVVMMLNMGDANGAQERQWLRASAWSGPAALSLVLLIELLYMLAAGGPLPGGVHAVGPRAVGIALYGPYLLAVELASFLLLAGLVGAYHLGRSQRGEP